MRDEALLASGGAAHIVSANIDAAVRQQARQQARQQDAEVQRSQASWIEFIRHELPQKEVEINTLIREFITEARAVPLTKIKFDHPNLAPVPPLTGNVVAPTFRGRFAAIKFPDPVQRKRDSIVQKLSALEADMESRFPQQSRGKFAEVMNANKWAPSGGYAGSWQDGWKIALTPNNSEIGNDLWRIHMTNALPACLKGSGIGYKLYSGFINYYGHACSSSNASAEAADVWNRLRKDPNFMFFASSLTGSIIMVITKRLAKPQVLELLNRFCGTRRGAPSDNAFFQLVNQVSNTQQKTPQQWLDDDIYEMFQSELANVQIAPPSGTTIPTTGVVTPERADSAYRSAPDAAAKIFNTTPQNLISVMADWLSTNGLQTFRHLDSNAKKRLLRTHYVLSRIDLGREFARYINAIANRPPRVGNTQIELYAESQNSILVKILNNPSTVYNFQTSEVTELVSMLGRLGFREVIFDERYSMDGVSPIPRQLTNVPVRRGGVRPRVRRLRTNPANLISGENIRPSIARTQFSAWTHSVGKTRDQALQVLQRRGGGPGALYQLFLDWFARLSDQQRSGYYNLAMPANQFRRILRDNGWRV